MNVRRASATAIATALLATAVLGFTAAPAQALPRRCDELIAKINWNWQMASNNYSLAYAQEPYDWNLYTYYMDQATYYVQVASGLSQIAIQANC